MGKKKISYALLLFALASFVSIAVGNILLGIAVLLYLLYAYKNGVRITDGARSYYHIIGFFILTMLLSAIGSGHLGKGLKTWADLWIWRFMPFVILTTAIKDYVQAKRILGAALVGVMIGVLCVDYQGFHGDYRAAGFFGNPMTFGGYLCIYLPVLLVLFFEKDILPRYRYLAGTGFILSFIALIFNGTRGAWVALIPVFILIMGYYACTNKKYLALCLVAVIGAGTVLSTNQIFVEKVKSITSTTNRSNTERLLIWQSAYNMFKDNPVLGVGLGQYKDSYQKKYILPQATEKYLGHAHNNFLQMLAENGLVGFIGFVVMLVYIMGRNLVDFCRKRCPYSLIILSSTLALVLQGLTEYNFGNSAVMKSYWLMLGCVLVMKEYKKRS